MPNKRKKTEKCQCWCCQWFSPRVKKLRATLKDEQLKQFDELLDELWNRYESAELDLDVLHAKIEGTWPKDDEEKYYERVGKNLFEVTGLLVESK